MFDTVTFEKVAGLSILLASPTGPYGLTALFLQTEVR